MAYANDLFSLRDQAVLITNGSGYLGAVMVNGLLDYGAKVAVAAQATGRPVLSRNVRRRLGQGHRRHGGHLFVKLYFEDFTKLT